MMFANDYINEDTSSEAQRKQAYEPSTDFKGIYKYIYVYRWLQWKPWTDSDMCAEKEYA